jgi:hypothetical protein
MGWAYGTDGKEINTKLWWENLKKRATRKTYM